MLIGRDDGVVMGACLSGPVDARLECPRALVSYREIADAMGRTDVKLRNNTFARHVSSSRVKLRDDHRAHAISR